MRRYNANLHSTMYLFQRASINITPAVYDNLHSTMYLFQQCYRCHPHAPLIIYIPLCIYFNTPLSQVIVLKTFIYIPLCIYFNLLRLFVKFYYHNLHSTMYLFQPFAFALLALYIIIYIPLCIYFNSHCKAVFLSGSLYLHSTMYLFQPYNHAHTEPSP